MRQRMTIEKCQLDKDGFAAVSVKPILRQPILRQPNPALDASARRPYLEHLQIFMLSSPLPWSKAQPIEAAIAASHVCFVFAAAIVRLRCAGQGSAPLLPPPPP